MKLKLNLQHLKRSLANCNVIASQKSIIPMTENVLITITQKEVTLRANGISIEIEERISISEAKDLFESNFVINCNSIYGIVNSIRDEFVVLEFTENKHGVTIKTKKGKHKINGYESEEFPHPLFKEKSSEYLDIKNPEFLFANLKSAGGFIETNDIRPALSRVQFNLSDDIITINGFCSYSGVHISQIVNNNFKVGFSFLTNKDTISKLCSMSITTSLKMYFDAKREDVVIMDFDKSSFRFINDSTKDLNYPNVSPFLKEENCCKASVSKEDLIDSVNRVSNLSNGDDGKANIISILFDKDFKTLAVKGQSALGESLEKLDILSTEDAFVNEDIITANFHSKQIKNVLNNCCNDDLVIIIQKPNNTNTYQYGLKFKSKQISGNMKDYDFERTIILQPVIL